MCLLGYRRILRIEPMGTVPYGPMLELQKQRHAEVATGDADDTLFLLEHPAVITLGRNSGDQHVLDDRTSLQQEGVDVVSVGRGGDVTYHAPGQLVGYPIIALQDEERDIRAFVTLLESIMIRVAYDFGITARRVDGLRGVWVGDEKLGAVGVRIAQWTSLHGFALNVDTDLAGFDRIVPCGIHNKGVTSMAKLLGAAPPMADVIERVSYYSAELLNRDPLDCPPTPLTKQRPPVAAQVAAP